MMSIEEPGVLSRPAAVPCWSTGHPLWQLGFRPFYLLAAVFAALAVPLWVARYLGSMHAWPQVGLGWHMHEMVFGFALAVVAGFLLTAVRAWTGLWTARGGQLMALAALWLAGRAALLLMPGPLAALLDWCFLPLLAGSLWRVLWRAGNTRNLFLIVLLALLALANGVFHLASLGWLNLAPSVPVQGAIVLVVMIASLIGARVIPMFTKNGAPGSTPVAQPRRAFAAMALMAAAGLAWVCAAPASLVAPLALGAALLSLLNLLAWQPESTVRLPLLWVLHLSYAWIPLGFALLALASFGWVTASAAFHALAVGAVAGLILGMMTRTTLGHTGRPLLAGNSEVAMYGLIQLAAMLRLLAATGPQPLRTAALVLAGLCWTLAFALFALVYAPYLWRARGDGKPG